MPAKEMRVKGDRLCKFLCSKEMYHEDNPNYDDLYSSGLFWCSHTSDCIGPDGTAVDNMECVNGRTCYEL